MLDIDARLLHIHTDLVPPRSRFEFWSDTFSPLVGQIDSSQREDFHQRFQKIHSGGLEFMRVQGSAAAISRRTPSQLMDAERYPFHLLLKVAEGAAVKTQRREMIVEAGDFTLIDSDGPLRLASMEATNSWTIGLPRVLVDRWLPDAADATETCFKGDKGWAKVLSAYLCATSPEHLRLISSPVERGFAVEHVMSMLAFAFAQNGFEKMAGDAESRVSPRDRELHVRMRRWIADNFSNPDVSAQSLAADFNISTRYVHKVFANVQRGVTFWGVVQDVRLRHAARLLRAPLNRGGSIEDVALRCGFVDTAYFSLVFRKRFGCTPRAFALKEEEASRGGVDRKDVPPAEAAEAEE